MAQEATSAIVGGALAGGVGGAVETELCVGDFVVVPEARMAAAYCCRVTLRMNEASRQVPLFLWVLSWGGDPDLLSVTPVLVTFTLPGGRDAPAVWVPLPGESPGA